MFLGTYANASCREHFADVTLQREIWTFSITKAIVLAIWQRHRGIFKLLYDTVSHPLLHFSEISKMIYPMQNSMNFRVILLRNTITFWTEKNQRSEWSGGTHPNLFGLGFFIQETSFCCPVAIVILLLDFAAKLSSHWIKSFHTHSGDSINSSTTKSCTTLKIPMTLKRWLLACWVNLWNDTASKCCSSGEALEVCEERPSTSYAILEFLLFKNMRLKMKGSMLLNPIRVGAINSDLLHIVSVTFQLQNTFHVSHVHLWGRNWALDVLGSSEQFFTTKCLWNAESLM